MNGFTRAAIAAIALSLGAAGANASVTYTYTGNNFTSAQAPYTTSDHVTISITQKSALGPNFSGNFAPTAYSVSDGTQTITSGLPSDSVGTDSTGKITFWNISANTGFGEIIDSFSPAPGAPGTAGDSGYQFQPPGDPLTGSNSRDPGTWKITATGVPEPATWAMMLGGLGGLGAALRSRRRAAFAA